MLASSKAFSGFAVDDLAKARQFYGETLGLNIETLDEEHGLLTLHLAGDRDTIVYLSPAMAPPSYTILNFPVDDIDQAVGELAARGVAFEQYANPDLPQDEKGVMREGGGPLIAWFKDPAGNTLSVLQDR
jgi:catechol 2,3-dioxygenase-like lactoylglutathione lyase family enzyme